MFRELSLKHFQICLLLDATPCVIQRFFHFSEPHSAARNCLNIKNIVKHKKRGKWKNSKNFYLFVFYIFSQKQLKENNIKIMVYLTSHHFCEIMSINISMEPAAILSQFSALHSHVTSLLTCTFRRPQDCYPRPRFRITWLNL